MCVYSLITILRLMRNLINKLQKHIRKGRDHARGHRVIMKDHFNPNPVFSAEKFHHHLCMSQMVFTKILDKLKASNIYFTQKKNTFGQPSLTPLSKDGMCTLHVISRNSIRYSR